MKSFFSCRIAVAKARLFFITIVGMSAQFPIQAQPLTVLFNGSSTGLWADPKGGAGLVSMIENWFPSKFTHGE